MTFGNFFPVDARNIWNIYHFVDDPKDWVNTDPILEEKKHRPMLIGEEFVLSTHWLDQIAYMRMANGEETLPPYKFRVLYPFLIGKVMSLEKWLVSFFAGNRLQAGFQKLDKYRLAQLNFWFFNYACLIAALIFLYKILRHFTSDPLLIYAGLTLFATQYAILKTASYAMVDVFSYLMFNLGLYALIKQKWALLGIMMALSVLSKDSMVIWTAALIAMHFEAKDKRLLIVAAIPLLTFMATRAVMGHDLLNVQYDWKVSQADLRLDFLQKHFGSLRGFINQIFGMLFAYGVLWLYLPKIKLLKRHNLAAFFAVFLILLLIAQLFLSTRIARVLALIYPLFLLLPTILFSDEQRISRMNASA
jgi:hypothetical protein